MNFFNTFIFFNINKLFLLNNLLIFLYYKFITRKINKYKLYYIKYYYNH